MIEHSIIDKKAESNLTTSVLLHSSYVNITEKYKFIIRFCFNHNNIMYHVPKLSGTYVTDFISPHFLPTINLFVISCYVRAVYFANTNSL